IPVSITSIASLSPLGSTPQKVWENYLNPDSLIHISNIGGKSLPVAALNEDVGGEVLRLAESDLKYRNLDNSVLYAILASRNAINNAGWVKGSDFGVNIGSSRGATALFEKHYDEYTQTGKASVQASPSTTLGNIASWVAHDLKAQGPDISHSITCSTALH